MLDLKKVHFLERNIQIMNFDYIIFDVDGTLWDTTEIVARSWNCGLEKLKFKRRPLTAADMKQEFGKTMDVIASDLFPQLPVAEGEAVLATCCQYEHEFLEKSNENFLYPDVENVFEQLAYNHKLFIVSNCQSGYIELFLEKNHLGKYVTDIECYGNTKRPKGENIRILLDRQPAGSACYIGDTAGDYCASKEAGVPFIFASYGFGDVPEAQMKISHFRDLLTLLK